MTYTQITASTLVSDLPDIINGVTTRAERLDLLTGVATSASLNTATHAAWSFALNENLSVRGALPTRADTSVAPVLQLALMPLTSESNKEVAFEFVSDTVTASNEPVANTGPKPM